MLNIFQRIDWKASEVAAVGVICTIIFLCVYKLNCICVRDEELHIFDIRGDDIIVWVFPIQVFHTAVVCVGGGGYACMCLNGNNQNNMTIIFTSS